MFVILTSYPLDCIFFIVIGKIIWNRLVPETHDKQVNSDSHPRYLFQETREVLSLLKCKVRLKIHLRES